MNVQPTVWVPETGRLVVRYTLRVTSIEMAVCYRSLEGEDHHYQNLITGLNGIARPYVYEFIEGCDGVASDTGDGGRIVRRYVYDSELAMIAAIWRDRMPYAKWIQKNVPGNLPEDEKQRLLRSAMPPTKQEEEEKDPFTDLWIDKDETRQFQQILSHRQPDRPGT